MPSVVLTMLSLGNDPVLAGRLDGKRAFARLLETLPAFNESTVVVLDFRSVDLATSSYLSEAVIAFRDHLRLRRVPAYTVVANLKEKVRDEFDELLGRADDALLACDLAIDGHISNPQLIGVLEPKLREIFELAKTKGEVGATDLHAASGDTDRVGPTAWNNRLNALAAKGLLMEFSSGRAKRYRPVLEAA